MKEYKRNDKGQFASKEEKIAAGDKLMNRYMLTRLHQNQDRLAQRIFGKPKEANND